MGADIHSFVEINTDNKWVKVKDKIFGDTSEPFSWRSYGVFGFLANVRNYSHVPPIIPENRGLPEDSEYLNTKTSSISGEDTIKDYILDNWGYHSHSYLFLNELTEFDYKQVFEDRRTCKQTSPNTFNGAYVVNEGEGELVKYEDFLGSSYFTDLEILKSLGNPEDVRIVFWFDN